jgi:aspartyl-tRNA(Asn)/glutamyl-tRNA(Gln) amidotransferase subunit C
MPTSKSELTKIAALAYLDVSSKQSAQLMQDVIALMQYVEQLGHIDTQEISPLLHPLDLYQPLRADEVTDHDHTVELAKIAPQFTDDLYLVPKVIDAGK